MVNFPNFFGCPPSYQNAIDLFKGEWSTCLPDSSGLVASNGPSRLCEDSRIVWGAEILGGFDGKNILELGPLEGGHSLLMEKMGAHQIVAIEANSRAFLKCLILKEAFGLTRVRFRLGDFLPYLQGSPERFHVAVACGVLYHLTDPLTALDLLTGRVNELLIWTHYYDESYFASASGAGHRFLPAAPDHHMNFRYTRHTRLYGESTSWAGFCGGGADRACWLSRPDLLAAFTHFGFEVVSMATETTANGPALLLAAKRIGHDLTGRKAFPETAYLDRYPDVRTAIVAGQFRSGAHHYELCGAFEGRIR